MYILTQNFVICITFFPKLQRIDIAKNIHTYTIKYFIAFVFAVGAVRYYCTKATKKIDINRCDVFIIHFILYHFVDFHAFDTHLFHTQDYRRIKLRLMIAVAIAADFEKYGNFHCLPCKKNKFVCHLLFLDVLLCPCYDSLTISK